MIAWSDLRGSYRRLAVATLVLYLVLVGLAAYVVVEITRQRSELREVAVTTAAALCTLRRDLEVRIVASENFLNNHPEGIQGISPAVIERSIAQQQQTVEALSILECPPLAEG